MEQYNLLENDKRKRNNIETSSNYVYINSLPYICRLLDLKLLVRLKEAEKSIPSCSKKEFIPYKIIYLKICRTFSITKEEANLVLAELRRRKYLDFVKFRGVKLKYEIKGGDVYNM